jgi:Fe-S-cluster containining protein
MQITKSTKANKIIELSGECKQCGKCCQFGSGYLLKEDIERIAKHFNISDEEFTKKYLDEATVFNTALHKPKQSKNGKAFGPCVFIKDGKCSIHSVKPLHCKISTCNEHGEDISVWFHLNNFVNENDPESVRQWKVYLESWGKNIPGGKLDELVKDKNILNKIIKYEILR